MLQRGFGFSLVFLKRSGEIIGSSQPSIIIQTNMIVNTRGNTLRIKLLYFYLNRDK